MQLIEFTIQNNKMKTIFYSFTFLFLFFCGNHSSDSASCLIQGSKINTPNGIEKIENLKVGDTVLSFQNNFFTTNEIIKVIKSKNKKKVFEIIFENLNNDFISENKNPFQTQNISATEDHLFFVANKDKYKKVLDLKIGDILLSDKNQKMKIIQKKEIVYNDYVYDISLKNEPHNYFANEVLVHNKSLPIPYFSYGGISILNKSKNIKYIKFSSIKKKENEPIIIINFDSYSVIEDLDLRRKIEISNYIDYKRYYENSNGAYAGEKSEFYQKNKNNNDFSSIDILQSPIKFYDSNNNFIFQITNSLSKISNPYFDDNEKLIKGTITINQSFIDNPFNGSKNED